MVEDPHGYAGDGHAPEAAEAPRDFEGAAESEKTPTEELPEDLRYLPQRERAQGLKLRKLFAEQEHGLRQDYADWIIRMLGAQLLIADAVFLVFAWAGRSWDLAPGVIEVWLAATVVQVVGVVAIVTRHLFPSRDAERAAT
jgi:hypothetical protein